MKGLSHCLWFDKEAEEAAKLYTSIFKNSKIKKTARYNGEGKEIHGQDEGKVMTVEFEIEGQNYVALNGGPVFTPNESYSVVVNCENQQEIDYYWDAFIKSGGKESECGWLKDKFGVSWQITPTVLGEMIADPDIKKSQRVTAAFLKMKKFNIVELVKAFEGR